jgi:integrase/recombinase XerD
MHVRLRYLKEDKDRHGNVRLYVRMPGRKKVRIRSLPGSPEFMAQYHAAVAGEFKAPERAYSKGSFGYVAKAFMVSSYFKGLDPATQQWRRKELEQIASAHGALPIAQMRPAHVNKLMDEKSTPIMADKRLKALQSLLKWALNNDLADFNPTSGVATRTRRENAKRGYHTWTRDEISKFDRTHRLGTQERLAKELLLYTAGRREDVVRLGPAHVRRGRVAFTQAKNEHRNPVKVDMPLHPDLAAAIKAYPPRGSTFLATSRGTPYSLPGFSKWFREACDKAGLPHCTPHGLRKAAATELAHRGATSKEIMAITGHQTLAEAERYTRAAEQKRLADAAMKRLRSGGPPDKSVGHKRRKHQEYQR